MASHAQVEANRQNAQKSTGPRTPDGTPDGKAAVRQNAFRHGFCSSLSLMSDESAEEAQQLLAALIEENQPVGVNEEILVYNMAEYFFYQQRASANLAEKLDWAERGDDTHREISLMLRYHTTAVRGFSKALHDLLKLQKERKLQEIGFVSQEVEETPAETPAAPQEAPRTPAAAGPKLAPEAATQPVPAPLPAEPTAARASQTRKSIEKEFANHPHTPQKAA